MKKWMLTLLVTGLALAPMAPARALDLELSPYGAYLDGDDLGEAWGGGIKLTFSLLEWLAVDARGTYLSYDTGDLEMYPVEATALLRLPLLEDSLVPYGGLGVGYYMFSSGDVELDDEVGFYPLVGVQWNLGEDKRIGVFAEIRWLFLEADVDAATAEFQNLDEADLDGFGVNAGVTIRF